MNNDNSSVYVIWFQICTNNIDTGDNNTGNNNNVYTIYIR